MLRIALIGYGQIAKSQHFPVLKKSPDFELVAVIDPKVDHAINIPFFKDLTAFLSSGLDCDCVAICTPPSSRFDLIMAATKNRLHVLLEKPPVSSLSELSAVRLQAAKEGITLFTAWHSRFAPCISSAISLLGNRRVFKIEISWQENHQKWHPGSRWLWKSGGFGAFDAGVNALSLLQSISDAPLIYREGEMEFENDAETPIRARLKLSAGTQHIPVYAWFDMGVAEDVEIWKITWRLHDGTSIELSDGGASLSAGGETITPSASDTENAHIEYSALYARFAALIARGVSEVVADPYFIATDCLAQGRRTTKKMETPDWVTRPQAGGT